MRALSIITSVLLIIGGINWGLVGLFDVNLVSAIFADGALARIVYTMVGMAALYKIYELATRDRLMLPSASQTDYPRRAA